MHHISNLTKSTLHSCIMVCSLVLTQDSAPFIKICTSYFYQWVCFYQWTKINTSDKQYRNKNEKTSTLLKGSRAGKFRTQEEQYSGRELSKRNQKVRNDGARLPGFPRTGHSTPLTKLMLMEQNLHWGFKWSGWIMWREGGLKNNLALNHLEFLKAIIWITLIPRSQVRWNRSMASHALKKWSPTRTLCTDKFHITLQRMTHAEHDAIIRSGCD